MRLGWEYKCARLQFLVKFRGAPELLFQARRYGREDTADDQAWTEARITAGQSKALPL